MHVAESGPFSTKGRGFCGLYFLGAVFEQVELLGVPSGDVCVCGGGCLVVKAKGGNLG